MAHKKREISESYFPELTGEEQREADEWLDGLLRLLLRICREHIEQHESRQAGRNTDASSYPHRPLDGLSGTGKLNTSRLRRARRER